jgi:hypothetical protein
MEWALGWISEARFDPPGGDMGRLTSVEFAAAGVGFDYAVAAVAPKSTGIQHHSCASRAHSVASDDWARPNLTDLVKSGGPATERQRQSRHPGVTRSNSCTRWSHVEEK